VKLISLSFKHRQVHYFAAIDNDSAASLKSS